MTERLRRWVNALDTELRYLYDERAAIYEYDAKYPRYVAERKAQRYVAKIKRAQQCG